jgi:hypothetical protein
MGCLLIYIVAIPLMMVLALPVILMRLITSRVESTHISRLFGPLIAGVLMGLYCSLGASLAINYFAGNENMLSYSYASNLLRIIAPIVGVVSGMCIQVGARLETRLEKMCYVFGIFCLVILAFYTTILIVAPE